MPLRLIPGLANTCAIATTLFAFAGPLSAAPVSATFNYTCVFPLIEEQPMVVDITSDMPMQLPPNQMTDAFKVDALAQVSAEAWNGLDFVGSRRLGGNVKASSSIAANGLSLPLTIPMKISATELPDAMASFSVPATGETPPLMFSEENQGDVEIRVGDLVMELEPLDSNQNPTGLGVFESECTLDEGQSGILHTIEIAPVQSTTPFLFNGQAFLKNNTPLLLNGIADLALDLMTGEVGGEMRFDDSGLSLKLIGFLNSLALDAKVVLTSVGGFEGLVSDGSMKAEQAVNLHLMDIQLVMFGFPVSTSGMGQCISKEPVVLNMESAPVDGFAILQGGKLEGQLDLPGFADCGLMTGIINLLLSGPDNEFELMLTPES